MSIIGLREQTVHGAKNIADACARHRWNIPADYNVAVDCLDRHTDLRDKAGALSTRMTKATSRITPSARWAS